MSDYVLYHYTPSLPAAGAFVAIFAILTVLHIVNIIRFKSTYFIPFTIGGIFEIAGFIGRALGHSNPTVIKYYVIQSLGILLAPSLFAASIYMILGRLIRTVRAESLSPIKVTLLTKVFVFGDCLSFFMQSTGGGMMSSGGRADLGQKIILAGLFAQILFFGLFVLVSVVFHMRLNSNPTSVSLSGAVPWKQYMSVLYITSGLILVRSLYRIVEYIQGSDGYLMANEWPIYVFDAALMAAVMAIFIVRYVNQLESKEASMRREIPGSHDTMLEEMENRPKYNV